LRVRREEAGALIERLKEQQVFNTSVTVGIDLEDYIDSLPARAILSDVGAVAECG
jgi:hypothetical protein